MKCTKHRIFTSIEVAKLLAKEMGWPEESGVSVYVTWKFGNNADDNTIEMKVK